MQSIELVRRFETRYLLALLSIAALSVAGALLLSQMVDRQSTSAQIVDRAGRQRMLSQRVGMLLSQPDSALRNEQLQKAVTELAEGHRWLEHPPGGAAPGELTALRRELTAHVLAVVADVRLAQSGDEEARQRTIARVRGPLLQGLEAQVALHADAARAMVKQAVLAERLMVGLVLLLLLLEALFIFRPLLNELRRTMVALLASLKATEEREAQLRLVLETSGDGFAITDDRGRLCGPASPRLAGEFSRLNEGPIWEALWPAGEERSKVQQVVEALAATPAWQRGKLLKGLPRQVVVDSRTYEAQCRIQTDEPCTLLWVLRDVTLTRAFFESERDRAAAEERARVTTSDKLVSLSTLAAGIGHQIANPVTVIGASTQFLLGALAKEGSPRPELVAAVQRVQDAVDQIAAITADVRVLSRGAGNGPAAIDCVTSIDRVLRLLEKDTLGRTCLERDLKPVPKIAATEVKVGQLVLNLLCNALQALPERQVELNLIKVSCQTDVRGRVVIEVEDNGQGMSPEVAKRAFDPFFTTQHTATGLGLSVCHAIVSSLGGEISFRTVEGEGSVFRVVLPPAELADLKTEVPVAQ